MAYRAKAAALAAARPFQRAALLALGLIGSSLPGVSRSAIPYDSLTPAVQAEAPAWVGKDVNGDALPDFANPTGHQVRSHDRFGFGFFGASRDGGGRQHAGVDYIAATGQKVEAPMSGQVSKVGWAYAGDIYRYVEITNPALGYVSRVFYVDPDVKVGDTVTVGQPVGKAENLQRRYRGITEHVHLEILKNGVHLDPATMIVPNTQVAQAPATSAAAG